MWNVNSATLEDISSWMNLVEKVRLNFPGLETENDINEYKNTVIKNVNRKTALCVKNGSKLVGILIYSIRQKRIGCMAVDPEYRQRGIGSKLIREMLKNFQSGDEITVSTFRDNDDKGIAPRAMYKRLGFEEKELCTEFNYPHQIFKLKML